MALISTTETTTTDLCTTDDVYNERPVLDEGFYEMIEKRIPLESELVRQRSGVSDLTKENLNARMACVYGILVWLEQNGLKPNSKGVAMETEGDMSRQYVQGTPRSTDQKTDQEEYWGYIWALSPSSFMGRTVGEGG